MAETPQEIVDRELREFKRYTGDGLPNEPVNAPLPVGDPQSGTYNPRKVALRNSMKATLEGAGAEVGRAKDEADRAEDEASRSHDEADRAQAEANNALSSKTQAELAAISAGAPLFTAAPDLSTAPSPYLLQVEAGTQVFTHDGTTATMVGWLGKVEFPTVAALRAWDDELGPEGSEIWADGQRFKVLASTIYNPDEVTDGGAKLRYLSGSALRDVPAQLSVSATAITDVAYDVGGPRPLEIFDGKLWGQDGDDIVSSEDGGHNWSVVAEGPSGQTLRGLIPAGDGEMLAQTAQRIYRSTGWPDTPSWSITFQNPTSDYTNIRRWGFDGENGKFIVTHYGAEPGGGRENSWGGWISTDFGAAFNLAWDSRDKFGSEIADLTHIHGVAYDPWADRFWIIEGHVEAISGPYYSDDGATWTKLDGELATGLSAAPTTITAASKGMVLAMDSNEPNGVAVIARTDDPSDMRMRMAYRWRQLSGFGDTAKRDPITGLVYIGWRSGDRPRNDPDWAASEDSNSRPPWISVSDGNTADIVYEYPNFDWSRADRFRDVIPDTNNGRVVGRFELDGTTTNFAGRLNDPGLLPATWHDRNSGVWGGFAKQPDSIAIGGGTYVPESRKITAVGPQAYFSGSDAHTDAVLVGFGAYAAESHTVVIGPQAGAEGPESVVIGSRTWSEHRDVVVVGYNASITGRWGIGIGHSTEAAERGVSIGGGTTPTIAGVLAVSIGAGTIAANNSVVMGQGAVSGKDESEGRQSVVIGPEAENEGGRYGVNIGYQSRVGAQSAIAIGNGTIANHTSSVALGSGSGTTGPAQVTIGGRHFELLTAPLPAAPAAGAVRFYADESGGKMRLMARFPTGVVQQIAIEP